MMMLCIDSSSASNQTVSTTKACSKLLTKITAVSQDSVVLIYNTAVSDAYVLWQTLIY